MLKRKRGRKLANRGVSQWPSPRWLPPLLGHRVWSPPPHASLLLCKTLGCDAGLRPLTLRPRHGRRTYNELGRLQGTFVHALHPSVSTTPPNCGTCQMSQVQVQVFGPGPGPGPGFLPSTKPKKIDKSPFRCCPPLTPSPVLANLL